MRLSLTIALLSLPAICFSAGTSLTGPQPAAPAPAVSSFEELVAQGRAAFLASDLDRATAAWNQACPADYTEYPLAREVTCENLLATIDEANGNLIRAEQRFLRAVQRAEEAGQAWQPLLTARLIDLGEHYDRQGRTADAEANLLRAVEIARQLTAVKPELIYEALSRLGGLYSETADPERGRQPLVEAIGLMTAGKHAPLAGKLAAELAFARSSLGIVELAASHLREAESNLREAVSLAAFGLGEDHPVTAMYQTNLALPLMFERQFGRATLLLERARFVVESRQGPSACGLGIIYAELSTAAGAEGRTAQAEDYAHRAVSILNLDRRQDAHALAIAQITLADAYMRGHNLEAAEKLLPGAVEMQRKLPSSPTSLGAGILLLAHLRAQQGNWQAAATLCREAITLYEKSARGGTNPALAPVLRTLAAALKHSGGSKEEVRALETRAKTIQQATSASSPRA
jgi:Tfp pilus assembly protein PilF